MEIRLLKKELTFDVKNISHRECESITDTEERYKIEAGTEKKDIIEREMLLAIQDAEAMLIPYVKKSTIILADNQPGFPDEIVIGLCMSERRAAGKLPVLAGHLHSYIVHTTLSRFYLEVSSAEFSQRHNAIAQFDAVSIERLVRNKIPPIR